MLFLPELVNIIHFILYYSSKYMNACCSQTPLDGLTVLFSDLNIRVVQEEILNLTTRFALSTSQPSHSVGFLINTAMDIIK